MFAGSQVGRLRSGAVAPAAFDFAAVHDDGARWGSAALDRLKADPSTAVAATARKAGQSPASYPDPEDRRVLTPEELAARITVLPPGRTLPASLLHADFGHIGGYPPSCFLAGFAVCTIRFVSLVENAPESALLLDGGSATLLMQTAPDQWKMAGTLSGPVG